jgi:hypothetical protein
MPHEIAIVNPTGVHPLIETHRSALFLFEGYEPMPVGPRTRLIPKEDLPRLVAALEATTRPAARKQIAKVIAMIAWSWPFAQQRAAPEVMEQYAVLMSQDLAHFPADILLEVVAELRRTSRFMPAVSEIYGPASAELYKRQRQLRLAEEHIQEHARRLAAEAEEAERRQRDAEHTQGTLSRINAFQGDAGAAYSAADLETARRALQQVGMLVWAEWSVALDEGDRWAIELFPAALDAGRRIDAESDHAAKKQASEALKRDFENARAGAAA